MKQLLLIALATLTINAYGQDKFDYVRFNKLTEDKFFASTWVVNSETGTLVTTGHYDSNDNKKYDKKDKSEIVIYDLKTLKLIHRI